MLIWILVAFSRTLFHWQRHVLFPHLALTLVLHHLPQNKLHSLYLKLSVTWHEELLQLYSLLPVLTSTSSHSEPFPFPPCVPWFPTSGSLLWLCPLPRVICCPISKCSVPSQSSQPEYYFSQEVFPSHPGDVINTHFPCPLCYSYGNEFVFIFSMSWDHKLYILIVRTEFELRVCHWTTFQNVYEFLIPWVPTTSFVVNCLMGYVR